MPMKHDYTLGLVGPLPPPEGGMATQTRQLVQLLENEGVDVTLVQTNKPYSPALIGKIKGLRALFRLVPYLFDIWLMAGKANVIHLMANSGWSWQLFAAPVIWIGWLRKTPVIVNYRGGYAKEYLECSFSRVAPTLRRARTLVVPSLFLKEVFAGFGVEAQIIPNIINVERFKPGNSSREGKPVRLIITRNLEPIYGIHTAIEALAIIRQTVPGVELLIAGSGPQLNELRQLAVKLGLEKNVSFVGRLDAEQIVGFYQTADIMLNPTTVDNMPNSVLEALACGIPVVSTNVGGIPYIVEHEKNALLVEPGNPAAIAAQVKRLLEDIQLRKALVANGLETIQPYTWPVVKRSWLQIYRSQAVPA